MKPVDVARPGVPAKDDPQVKVAMGVWDALTSDEQREVFQSLYRTVAAYGHTKDIDHLTRFAESVDRMVRLESTTDLRQRIRDQRNAVPEPADPADVEDLLRRLEG
ncbi:hypothetical protein AB0H37_23495 [Actinomadura sp. NPDC023710]|uniref:hypothetical protein n=1 Tax=Actinomadura sp. NPDC023710 TaxID=3158219 RepID=UPI00340E2834